MYNCTVLIPIAYPEEGVFLKRTLLNINKYKHPEVEVEVMVADQTESNVVDNLQAELALPFISNFKCARIDAGHPIDQGTLRANGEYFITLDVDCAPIHKSWAYVPIKLIDKHKTVGGVGKQTGLHLADAYKVFGNFCHINNYYRTMRTEHAKMLSTSVGFTRYENRYKSGFIPKAHTNWSVHCDNGVVAQWYSDQINLGPKVSLALNKILGFTNEMGVFGMVIDDLVFHFVFSSSKDWIHNKYTVLGDKYMHWYNRIYKDGFTDELFNEVLDNLIPHHNSLFDREFWDGSKLSNLTPQSELFRDIVEWKSE